jgi:outer membrane protein
MPHRFYLARSVLGLVAALACAATASAQSAGQFTAKLGLNRLTPKVESGEISAPALPGTRADVGSDSKPVLIIAYGLTDHLSLETCLGTSYQHAIHGAGAIDGTGKLGTVEALPPTLFAQHRFFTPTALLRPFIGIGATYVHFIKERGSARLTAMTNPGSGVPTTFSIDGKLTYTAQVGVALNFSEKWFADVTVNKARLRTNVQFSTGQTQHMKLDPVSMVMALGYKF